MRTLILAAIAALSFGTAQAATWNYNGIVPGEWTIPTRAQSFYTTKPTDATDRVQRRVQNRQCISTNCGEGINNGDIVAYRWEWRVEDNQGDYHYGYGNGPAPRNIAVTAAITADLLYIADSTNFNNTAEQVQANDALLYDGTGTRDDPHRVNWSYDPVAGGVSLLAKHIGQVYQHDGNLYKLKRTRNTLHGQPGQAEWIWSGEQLTVNGLKWSNVNAQYRTSKCQGIKKVGYNTETGLNDPDN